MVVIITAIKNNALDYKNPPIKNLGYKGIKKTIRLRSGLREVKILRMI